MDKPIIEVNNISKKYVISHNNSYSMLRDNIANVFREKPKSLEEFWALKNISFSVNEGEVLGIIGKNGSGKSTLLKILSRITTPTEGSAKIRGRIGSLLEVGTGFNPELTGRENVYLNGSILGMTMGEIRRKFDTIVDFSGVEKFLDTPVKKYSSGMYVRLAFSVAAFLEPEILIIDEVLSVGDLEFQSKCMKKMGDVANGGKTILFVSHSMGSVAQLCKNTMYLEDGHMKSYGKTEDVISAYTNPATEYMPITSNGFEGTLKDSVSYTHVDINNKNLPAYLRPSSNLTFVVKGTCTKQVKEYKSTLSIYANDVRLTSLHDSYEPQSLEPGTFEITYKVGSNHLRPGTYTVGIGGHDQTGGWIYNHRVGTFTILEEWDESNPRTDIGIVNLDYTAKRLNI